MTHTGIITEVSPTVGGWHTKIDDSLALAIVQDEWNRPGPTAVGDRVRYRVVMPEFMGLVERAGVTT